MICVPDVYATCARLHAAGVPFLKSPNQGRQKGFAFVKDPDGYRVEIYAKDPVNQVLQAVDCLGVETDLEHA